MAAALLAFLPTSLAGCLAINAMFGVLGLVGPAPIQYAGTAYSVGEYTYQFAVNDKTPDEVLGEKFAWLIGPDASSTPQTFPSAPTLAEPTLGKPTLMLADAGAAPMAATEPVVMVPVSMPLGPATSEESEAAISREPTPDPDLIPIPMRRAWTDQPDAGPARAVVAARAGAIGPDLLAQRLNRLESSLAQAERMYLRGIGQGVRCTASTPDGQGGVSGTGSVRHPVMQAVPAGPWRVARPDSAPEVVSDAGVGLPARS